MFVTMTVRSRLPVWPWHTSAVDEGKKKGVEIVFLARCLSRLNEKTLLWNHYTFQHFSRTFIAYEIVSKQETHVLAISQISDRLILSSHLVITLDFHLLNMDIL